MESLKIKKIELGLQVTEIILTVSLIGMLYYFYVVEKKQHEEMMSAMNKTK
jgi:hypothetical protein